MPGLMNGTTIKADGPRRVDLSKEDLEKGSYSPMNLQKALEGLHQDGMVVLRDLVDPSHCDALYDHMTGDRDRILQTNYKDHKVYNQGVKSNILQCPPFTKSELLFDDVYFNPFVIQVMNAYLGDNPKWAMTTGNNALPGTAGMRQPVHKDTRFKHPKCPFVCIANTALNDFNIENGATEFWLGTHAFTDEREQIISTPETVFQEQTAGTPTCFIKEEVVEARRLVRPPVMATMKKGDVMLRDFRCWHAGMPNSTDKDRIMIAQGWMANWYANYTIRFKLPKSKADFFLGKARGKKMEVVADLVSDQEAEDFQHRDNFRWEQTHFTEYYETAQPNFSYSNAGTLPLLQKA